MTQNPAFNPEDQWQAARAAGPTSQPANGPSPQPTGGAAPQYAPPQRAPQPQHTPQSAGVPAVEGAGKVSGRPSNLALAGAGSLLAVLAFVGGMAVGHSWDGTSTQQNQFPGGGGFGRFPGQGNGPGQGTTGQGNNGTGQGNNAQGNTGQGNTGQGQGSTGQGQGTVPGQGTQPGTGTQSGPTQTS